MSKTKRFEELRRALDGDRPDRRILRKEPLALAMFILGDVASSARAALRTIPDTRFGRKLKDHLEGPVEHFLMEMRNSMAWLDEVAMDQEREFGGAPPNAMEERARVDAVIRLLNSTGATSGEHEGCLSVWSHVCTDGKRRTMGRLVKCSWCGERVGEV